MSVKLKLIERHKNGAYLEISGTPEEIVPIVVDWRKYQDGIPSTRNVAGFKSVEEKN